MASDLREALSKFVPASVLDEAVEAVKDTEVAPEWYRAEVAKLGADAKEAKELRTRLESIELAPKRKEALQRVGIDYDAQPKFAQKFLDSIDAKTLDNLDKLAETVQNEGFEANLSTEQNPGEQSGAERITAATVALGTGAPVRGSEAQRQEAFLKELEAMDDVGNPNATTELLAKYGLLPATEG